MHTTTIRVSDETAGIIDQIHRDIVYHGIKALSKVISISADEYVEGYKTTRGNVIGVAIDNLWDEINQITEDE